MDNLTLAIVGIAPAKTASEIQNARVFETKNQAEKAKKCSTI